MDINALSNPYLRQDFPVEALPVPVENPEQARQDPAARSLVVKINERTAGLTRRKTTDSIDISSSAKEDRAGNDPSKAQSDNLTYDLPRMRNWDHRLVAWFRTAFTVQGNISQNRGIHIDIVV
ncbi:MAG: hypothetical protein HZB31_01885 [Nitrospirae bacterium]|nr:hypothetical protein [Nitrospirota bacterium]